MDRMRKIIALIVVFGFVSCTNNTEIIEQQNEKFEILGSDKSDSTTPNSNGNTDVDEDND